MSWTSVFDTVFDTVVVGGGYAGYAAALERRSRGEEVLVLTSNGAVLWESGQAFARAAGTSPQPRWSALVEQVERRGGRAGDWLDGAITEVVGNHLLNDAGVRALHFVRPVAVHTRDGLVAGVTVASKSGSHLVRARRWVDATERGDLLRLADPAIVAPEARAVRATATMQHPAWPEAVAEGTAATAWDGERTVEVESDASEWREELFAAIDEIGELLGDDASRLCVSHLSFVALPLYDQQLDLAAPVANIASAVPASADHGTLAERFEIGVRAAGQVESLAAAAVYTVEPDAPRVVRELSADVVVAGVGTGGVLATVAAARSGATVLGVEAFPFAGGVGPAGGIHAYWFGAPGGMQSELDDLTHEVMSTHSRGPYRDGPYNPWAKRRAIDAFLAQSGVDVLFDAIVFDAERTGGRITAILAATADGVVRITGRVFVDGTGDGDLAVLAGAEFDTGRVGDSLLHAHSQSSGRLREVGGEVRMDVVNFDAGFCDPTDVEDLTRARDEGVRLYLVDGPYSNLDRPTYIAPAVGVRQGRLVRTELRLELDDLVRRRRFPDAVGYTASHVDSHGSDFEFDTDESVFWQLLNRSWGVSVSCELSYRMMLPVGIDNLLLASRCIGLSQDANYAVRMQRDIQRIGEVAGRAAALALSRGGDVRRVPIPRLQEQLEESSALGRPPRALERGFGVAHDTSDAPRERTSFDLGGADADDERAVLLERALAQLDSGAPGEAIWWLLRHEELAQEAVAERLASPKSETSWLAAGILAMWGRSDAQPRLIQAIADAEYGFDDVALRVPAGTGKYVVAEAEPLTWHKLVPNWLTAISLLRSCGDADAFAALEEFVDGQSVMGLSTCSALLLTIERLFERGVGATDPDRIRALVAAIQSKPLVGVVDYTSRASGYFAEKARRGEPALDAAGFLGLEGVRAEQLRNMYVDMSWQPALVAARICVLLGDAPDVEQYRRDPRGFVRRAFANVLEADA